MNIQILTGALQDKDGKLVALASDFYLGNLVSKLGWQYVLPAGRTQHYKDNLILRLKKRIKTEVDAFKSHGMIKTYVYHILMPKIYRESDYPYDFVLTVTEE